MQKKKLNEKIEKMIQKWKDKEQTYGFAPYYFMCFKANSQAETTNPLKEYSFLSSPLFAFSTISIIYEFNSTGNLILLYIFASADFFITNFSIA